MIIAGAGGHALELYDLIRSLSPEVQLEIFDRDQQKKLFKGKFPILHQATATLSTTFAIGVGDPNFRKAIYTEFTSLGKSLLGLQSKEARISDSARLAGVDVFYHCFIGPEVRIGLGTLVNTGAQVHHEARVGEFTVINPGAFLLGAVQVGDQCSIGAHATLLPGVKIGNQVTIGAGAVVIKDVGDGETVVGVPAVSVRSPDSYRDQ
ncbi:acetyltransferase [Algoriphagus namhaensis]